MRARTEKYRRRRRGERGGQLSEMARTLQAEPDVAATLQAIVAAPVINIPGADYAAITLVTPGGKVGTPAFSDSQVERVERLQDLTDQGPCLSAAREQLTFRTDDLHTETRWPLFTRRAADLGVRSMLSFQLYVQEENLGALNLYGRRPGAFGDGDEDIGLLFAGHARGGPGRRATPAQLGPGAGRSGYHRAGQRHPDGTLQNRRRPSLRSAGPRPHRAATEN